MNGRIERLFGTLKNRLQYYTVDAMQTISDDLALFRIWFNHVRPHQYLNGRTPAEAWNRQAPNPKGRHCYFHAWQGALAGFYLPPT